MGEAIHVISDEIRGSSSLCSRQQAFEIGVVRFSTIDDP